MHEVRGIYDTLCDDCIEELMKDGKIAQCNWCNEYYDASDDYYGCKMIRKDDRSVVDICEYCHKNSTYVQANYDDVEEAKEGDDVDKE